MDLASLKEAAANLTLYDLKAGVRKVQNAVMNYTEMEAKVREATNNEPWGASSTMLQEIANGTYNYQLLNEIMPMIYKRFTEKAAEEWRQIYKALQLLEFLIKNGSERVIDDARSHLTLLKMLRQFHYIDQNGKDQGLNVRNRAKELAELLSDVERIRAERKKSRATRNKYTGVEGGAGLGGGMSSSSSRYGGFGSEESGGGSSREYGGYSGGVYGDGGGFGGQSSDFQDTGSRRASTAGGRDRFEEYDEYDEGAAAPPRRQAEASSSSASRRKTAERPATKKQEPPKKKEPEVDLFSFDDPIPTTSAPLAAAPATSKPGDDFDDDFDDFQSAAPSTQAAAPSFPIAAPTAATTPYTQYAAPQPVSAPKAANLSDLVGFSSISPAPSVNATPVNYSAFSPPVATQQAPRPTAYQGSQPNYFTSVQAPSAQASQPNSTASTIKSAVGGAKPAGGDAFGSLWSSASAGVKKSSTPTAGPALGQLAKEKASAGIWGAGSSSGSAPSQAQKPAGQQSYGNGLDDLLR
ncbi:epsin-3 [Drepanopeziza brunnea f. sp. 'multigermtubi' MB_m1]|uniref:Epsin-3 n=1 Tax=Marssonina brunnea f. sp. multigermtubi (strain MB_m1) TaxID=1072389 RepID=K1WZG3_MARBU|nr:epsin-3 [Drepanopeziza brunnea f. sp. 'multigermtubi' MB_m1]EKD18386.1 epsin-3 [Drepanopeziza brunnea f. sp. 'multigermtubi' MB_m1]